MSVYKLQEAIYQSADFKLDRIASYELLLQIAERDLFIVIFSPSDKRFLYKVHYADSAYKGNILEVGQHLKHLVQSHGFLGANQWKRILLVTQESPFTLIPTPLFDEGRAYQLLASVAKWDKDSHDLALVKHQGGTIVNLSAYHVAFRNFLNEVYPDANCAIVHQSSCFLEGLRGLGNKQTNTIHAFLDKNYLYLAIVAQDESVLFFNAFKIKSKDDVLYFVLSVAEQYAIPAAELEVMFYNPLSLDSMIKPTLKKYVKDVNIHEASFLKDNSTKSPLKFDLWGSQFIQHI